MIREHVFNSRWWGRPVGIVEDPAFFSRTDADRASAMAPYDWVEFRCGLDAAPPRSDLARAGFAQVDTQLRFRIALKRIPPDPSGADALEVRFADEGPLDLPEGDWPNFAHERFRHLPGASPARIADRYALWSRMLVEKSPEWCAAIRREGKAQGWFLAEPEGEHVHLALAMLRPGGALSGLELYRSALEAFGRRSRRHGEARFSAENLPVLNLYARLGAVFVEAIGCWIWSPR